MDSEISVRVCYISISIFNKKAAAAAMDGIKNNATTHIPHEIIQDIISRFPVKSLLRFKAVSKQWNTTISDRKFAATHVRRSKNSSTTCLLQYCARRVLLVDFPNDKPRLLSIVDYPPLLKTFQGIRFLCHCDGLYIILCFREDKILLGFSSTDDYLLYHVTQKSLNVACLENHLANFFWGDSEGRPKYHWAWVSALYLQCNQL